MKKFHSTLFAITLAIAPAALAHSFDFACSDSHGVAETGILKGRLIAPGECAVTAATIDITARWGFASNREAILLDLRRLQAFPLPIAAGLRKKEPF
jgi:hypothetical protein